jgi:RNA polymerase sigma factor (sigma-70 family)
LLSEESQLLREYVATRSEQAFRRLVDRYVNVVYAAARRQVRDADLARDVTQAVFLVLAEKAAELRDDAGPGRPPLSAWLLQVTRYAAANAVRARARRARHEQKAAEMATTTNTQRNLQWEHLSPLLDEGMSRLRANDRDVLLLRFFEQKTAREVGEAMGISEDAAEKRITRAVEKLRDFFQRRGVAVSLVALTTTLAANCAEAAPVGLTASIAASAASAATTSATTALTSSAIAKGTVFAMASAKAKTALLAACALLLIGGGAVGVTTLVKSSKPRQVIINPGAAAAASTFTGMPAPHALRFAQGTTIELLYVSDESDNPARWWSADGTPVAPPSPVPGRNLSVGATPAYMLVLRKTDPVGAYPSMQVRIGGANVAGAAATEDQAGRARLHTHLFAVRGAAPAVVDVRVGLAAGEWSEPQRYPLPSSASMSTAAAATRVATTAPAAPAALIVGDVRADKNGRATVGFRFAPGADELRASLDEKIVLVTTDGRELYAQSWSGGGGGNVLTFNVPRAQAAALTYQSRPYETGEIRNVSLRPGQKTIVAAGDVPIRGR